MRLRIEDGGYTLSIEYRCEKHEVRDIKSFYLILSFWLLECYQVRLMPLMYLPVYLLQSHAAIECIAMQKLSASHLYFVFVA